MLRLRQRAVQVRDVLAQTRTLALALRQVARERGILDLLFVVVIAKHSASGPSEDGPDRAAREGANDDSGRHADVFLLGSGCALLLCRVHGQGRRAGCRQGEPECAGPH